MCRGLLVTVQAGIQQGVETDLRIDDDAARFAKVHHHVGPQRSVSEVHLLHEVHVGQHARCLHNAPQLHLTPQPLMLRAGQGTCDPLGLRAHLVGSHTHLPAHPEHLLAQAAQGIHAAALGIVHTPLQI